MYILGVNLSHHPSTCLLKDGEIDLYIEEERISKQKYSHIENEEYVVLGDGSVKEFGGGYYAIKYLKNITYIDVIIFASFGSKYHDPRRIDIVLSALEREGISWGRYEYDEYEHHIYHAYNSFYASGFKEAVAIVMDGGGALDKTFNENQLGFFREGESVYHCSYSDNVVELQKNYTALEDLTIDPIIKETRSYSNHIPSAWLFSKTCEIFKFYSRGGEAGKLMGMSAYGTSISDIPWYREDNISINTNISSELLSLDVSKFQMQANFCAKLQEQTKMHTIRFMSNVIDKYNPKNIVLSGGYFMNCVNNYAYLKAFPQIKFFVDPIAFDSGTAIGAAKKVWYNISGDTTIRKFQNLYFGPNNAYVSRNK
jgi:carbamoyltransferase